MGPGRQRPGPMVNAGFTCRRYGRPVAFPRVRSALCVHRNRFPFPAAGGGAVRRIVRRNLTAFLGLAVLALVAALAASLATWTIDDPSLSHATDRAVRNVLGLPGAIVADLLTQFLGLAPSVLLLPPVIWGWRAVFAVPSRFGWLTGVTWLAGTLFAALALATVPPPTTWPLPTGLGGLAGDLLVGVPAWLLGARPQGLSVVRRRRPRRPCWRSSPSSTPAD